MAGKVKNKNEKGPDKYNYLLVKMPKVTKKINEKVVQTSGTCRIH